MDIKISEIANLPSKWGSFQIQASKKEKKNIYVYLKTLHKIS